MRESSQRTQNTCYILLLLIQRWYQLKEAVQKDYPQKTIQKMISITRYQKLCQFISCQDHQFIFKEDQLNEPISISWQSIQNIYHYLNHDELNKKLDELYSAIVTREDPIRSNNHFIDVRLQFQILKSFVSNNNPQTIYQYSSSQKFKETLKQGLPAGQKFKSENPLIQRQKNKQFKFQKFQESLTTGYSKYKDKLQDYIKYKYDKLMPDKDIPSLKTIVYQIHAYNFKLTEVCFQFKKIFKRFYQDKNNNFKQSYQFKKAMTKAVQIIYYSQKVRQNNAVRNIHSLIQSGIKQYLNKQFYDESKFDAHFKRINESKQRQKFLEQELLRVHGIFMTNENENQQQCWKRIQPLLLSTKFLKFPSNKRVNQSQKASLTQAQQQQMMNCSS